MKHKENCIGKAAGHDYIITSYWMCIYLTENCLTVTAVRVCALHNYQHTMQPKAHKVRPKTQKLH